MPATPILDLEQPPPEARDHRQPVFWIFVASAVAMITWDVLRDRGILPDWRLPDTSALLMFPILYVEIALHELGHAMAAKAVGIDLGGISVGPAIWHKSGDKWVFRWVWRRWGGGFFKPLTGGVGLDPAPFAWSVAGGPLVSLVLTLLAAALWIQYGDGAWSSIGTVFWMSLLTFAMTVAPFSSGVNKSDGARLWQFRRHPRQARQVMGLLGVQSEEAQGVRPRDWSPELFAVMMAVESSAAEYVWCELMAFYRVVDEGFDEQALVHLENALAGSARCGKLMRHALFLEAACSSARIRGSAASAREWYARATKLQKPISGAAVNAVIAMREGNYQAALTQWAAARARVDKLRIDSGLVRFAKAKWGEMETECQAALAQGATQGEAQIR